MHFVYVLAFGVDVVMDSVNILQSDLQHRRAVVIVVCSIVYIAMLGTLVTVVYTLDTCARMCKHRRRRRHTRLPST